VNCKQGDLAMVIGGSYNLGKVLTCLEFVGMPPIDTMENGLNLFWRVDTAITYYNFLGEKSQHCYIDDTALMPLNGEDRTKKVGEKEYDKAV